MFGYEENTEPTIVQVLNGESPAINDPTEIQFTPGTNQQYSNMGYVIIQKYLEDITSKNFNELMKELLFNPLEMKNSQFGYHSDAIRKNAIVPHDQNGEAKDSGIHPTALAMGGLITTPRDLSKFVIELMKGFNEKETKHLSSSVIQKMLTQEVELDPSKWFGFTEFLFYPGKEKSYYSFEKNYDFCTQ